MRTTLFVLVLVVLSATPLLAQADAQLELALWNAVKDSNDPVLLNDYLRKYPEGTFALVARTRLHDLNAPPAPAALPTKPGPKPGEQRVNPKDGLMYVWIPAGTFMVGCNPVRDLDVLKAQGRAYRKDKKEDVWIGQCPEESYPSVRVGRDDGFWLGQTEVTLAAFNRYRASIGEKPFPGRGPEYPVVNTEIFEANEFCKASGGGLPGEAEWEYAARGPKNDTLYGSLNDVAWTAANCKDCSEKQGGGIKGWLSGWGKLKEKQAPFIGNPVAQKQANGFGLYDMIGNVAEWTSDVYVKNYNSVLSDMFARLRGAPAIDAFQITEDDLKVKPGIDIGYTVRGGAAGGSTPAVFAAFARAPQRFTGAPHIGFRCILPELE